MPTNFQKEKRHAKHWEERREQEEQERERIASQQPDTVKNPKRSEHEKGKNERIKKIHQGRLSVPLERTNQEDLSEQA